MSLLLSPPVKSEIDETIQTLTRVSQLLDAAFEIPGTRVRVGWDSIVGLIPGFGDVVTATPLIYYLMVIYKHRLGWLVALKVILNQVLDIAIGAVPLLGDILDVAFKSNLRNATLLIAELERRAHQHGNS